MTSYSCDQIQVLKGLEPIRKRPGMYIGDTDGPEGRHHLLWELIENVIDQHVAGQATELHVTLGPGTWVTVKDDGPGIPIEPRPDGRPIIESVFTQLHAGGRHTAHGQLRRGWYGVGLAAVSALSARVEVETTRNGIRWAQAFERGERVAPLRRVGPTSLEGTTIRFCPDPMIFRDVTLDPALVGTRLEELAWLNPHLRVVFQERRIRGRGGLLGWATTLANERGAVVCSHGIERMCGDINVEIGLAWNATGKPIIRSFVNVRPTTGGTHVAGLFEGFFEYARRRNSPARMPAHVREAILPGLVATLHVCLPCPNFGPSRSRLRSTEAVAAVKAVLLATSNRKHLLSQSGDGFFKSRLGLVQSVEISAKSNCGRRDDLLPS